jgi:putative phosphoribosyl transferase
MLFRNRRAAGEALGALLVERGMVSPTSVVLGLPRGGVPVAERVAAAGGCSLDVFVVRKLGVPGHEEFAMGAIASGGIRIVNRDVVRRLDITEDEFEAVVASETAELERREMAYRGDRAPLELSGRDVVLVDDGIATGASMRAAVAAVRQSGAKSVVVAVPVAPSSAARVFEGDVDAFIAASAPDDFMAVGAWYEDFTQVTDPQVRDLLGVRGDGVRE